MLKVSRLPFPVLLAFLSLFLAAIPFQAVQADAGPKPSMSFVFTTQLNPAPTIVSGKLLECQDQACAVSEPLQELGPQGFTCQGSSCGGMAYSYSPYHRLEIEFSDGVTRQSNIFTKRAYAASYLVTVYADRL